MCDGRKTFEFLFVGCEFLMVFSFGFEVFELDMIGLSKSSDGVTIVETLDIHIEADRISSFATSEAFIDLLGRRDEKRRGLFTMKRTKTSVVASRFLQRHISPDKLGDIDMGDDKIGECGHVAKL